MQFQLRAVIQNSMNHEIYSYINTVSSSHSIEVTPGAYLEM